MVQYWFELCNEVPCFYHADSLGFFIVLSYVNLRMLAFNALKYRDNERFGAATFFRSQISVSATLQTLAINLQLGRLFQDSIFKNSRWRSLQIKDNLTFVN